MKNTANKTENDVLLAGTDLFADSESFLNELSESETVQARGASYDSHLSLLLCEPLTTI